MKVFFMPQQTARKNVSFSPSAGKPALAVQSWKARGLPVEIIEFAPVTREQLYKVHAPEYVNGVLDLKCSNGFGNRLPEVAEALPYVAGSMTAAALHAAGHRETTFSPTSGAHHAMHGQGGGYCTFNFLVLAAVEVHEAGYGNVGIIDCDRHYGDGTDDIIRRLGLDFIMHYSFGGDVLARRGTSEQWLDSLPAIVGDIARQVSLLIYNAGADPHIDDPLGGILTMEQLQRRDEIVFEVARACSVPVAVSLAGGYQKRIRNVLAVHDNTFETACRSAAASGEDSGSPDGGPSSSPGGQLPQGQHAQEPVRFCREAHRPPHSQVAPSPLDLSF